MVNSFSSKISGTCILGSAIASEANGLAIDEDSSCPSFLVFMDSNKARFTVFMRFVQVLHISFLANITKIAQSVVARVAVYMVNVRSWVKSMHKKPSKTVAIVEFTIKAKM